MSVDQTQWLLGADEEFVTKPKRDFNVVLTKPRVKLTDVAWMTKNLAKTQRAGMPLFRALGMLAAQRPKDAIGERILDIQSQMGDEGASLSDAMRSHEKDFGALVCALVEAGEAGGGLENSLNRAAQLTESRVRLRRKVRGALIYPVSVVVITTALIAALLIFLVPRFADIYSSLGSDLPAMTQLLVTLSDLAPWGVGVVAALAATYYVIERRSRKELELKRRLDKIKLGIPVIGSIIRKGANARIASTLASLLSAGVPLLQSLGYSRSAADLVPYQDSLSDVRQQVSDGRALHEALALAPEGLYPPIFVQYAVVGEESGSLPELMESYAKDSEEEVTAAAEAITRLIEPVTMVLIGGVVGFFIIGLYLPMIQIGDQIK